MSNHIPTASMSTPAPGALAEPMKLFLGSSYRLIGTTVDAVGIVRLTAFNCNEDWIRAVWPDGGETHYTFEEFRNLFEPASALATAQPAADSPMELATSLLVDYELERQQLTLERDRLKQDCANLLAACKPALELLDKQREEYNSMFTLLPRETVEEGPIAKALREAIKGAETK